MRHLTSSEQSESDNKTADRLKIAALVILVPVLAYIGFAADHAYRKAIVIDAMEEIEARQGKVNQ